MEGRIMEKHKATNGEILSLEKVSSKETKKDNGSFMENHIRTKHKAKDDNILSLETYQVKILKQITGVYGRSNKGEAQRERW